MTETRMAPGSVEREPDAASRVRWIRCRTGNPIYWQHWILVRGGKVVGFIDKLGGRIYGNVLSQRTGLMYTRDMRKAKRLVRKRVTEGYDHSEYTRLLRASENADCMVMRRAALITDRAEDREYNSMPICVSCLGQVDNAECSECLGFGFTPYRTALMAIPTYETA